jgi:excinuclease ABC subunit C
MRLSVLNTIPGVGPKRRKALIKHFRTLEGIRSAALEELISVPGISKPAAEAAHAFFRSQARDREASQ